MATSQGNRRTQSARPTSFFALEAERLLSSGFPKQAIELCKRGLVYYPEHVSGYLVLAQSYLALGQNERALNVLRDGNRRTGSAKIGSLVADMGGEKQISPPAPHESPSSQPDPIVADNGVDQNMLPAPLLEPTAEEPIAPADAAEAEPVKEEAPDVAVLDTEAVEEEVAVAEINEEPQAVDVVPQGSHEEAIKTTSTAQEGDISTTLPELDVSALPEVAVDEPAASQPQPAGEPELMEPTDDRAHLNPIVEENVDAIEPIVEAVEMSSRWPYVIGTGIELVGDDVEEESIVAELPPPSRTPASIIEMPPMIASDKEPDTSNVAIEQPSAPVHDPRTTRPFLYQTDRPATHEGETQSDRSRPLSLALHKGLNVARLRSSNLRLIPGLEFAPLRHEEQARRQTIAPLFEEPIPELDLPNRSSQSDDSLDSLELPKLPGSATEHPLLLSDEGMIDKKLIDEKLITSQPPSELPPTHPQQIARQYGQMIELVEQQAVLTPLEELARRLESARIPVVEEPEQRNPFEPSIVSDTLANILVAQGAYAEALKAYQTLARIKPERFDYYQGKIQEMLRLLQDGQ